MTDAGLRADSKAPLGCCCTTVTSTTPAAGVAGGRRDHGRADPGHHLRGLLAGAFPRRHPIETLATQLSPVRILLPLSTRPKKPLLNFALHGPGGRDVHLLTRREVAKLQRALIDYMLEPSPLRDEMRDCWPPELLDATFAFTPDVFAHREAQVGWLGRLSRDRHDSAYRDYLSTDAGIELSRSPLTECLAVQDHISNALSEVLGEEPDPHSSTEQPLLALPNFEAHGLPLSGSEVVELLQ